MGTREPTRQILNSRLESYAGAKTEAARMLALAAKELDEDLLEQAVIHIDAANRLIKIAKRTRNIVIHGR